MSMIFISHAEQDADLANECARSLSAAGYDTWCYEENSLPGTPYLLQVGDALDRCSAVLLIVSAASLKSNQVTNEVIRAYENARPFLPILRDISHLEFQQRQPLWRQALGATTSIAVPREGLARIMPRVIAGLKAMGVEPGRGAVGAPSAVSVAPPAPPTAAEPQRPPRVEEPSQRAKTPRAAAPRRVGRVRIVLIAAALASLLVIAVGTTWYLVRRQKIAALRGPVTAAMNDGAWNRAADLIEGLLAYAPRDSQSLRAKEQVEAGRQAAYRTFDFKALHVVEGHKDDVVRTAFSPDGQYLVSASLDGSVRIWRVADGTLARVIDVGAPVRGLSVSEDGQYIVTGSVDRLVEVWRLDDGTLVRRAAGHRSTVTCVLFADGDRSLVSGSRDSTVRVWDPGSGTELRRLSGAPGEIWHMAISPNARYVAGVGRENVGVIWDLEKGTVQCRLTGHRGGIGGVSFTPDGNRVVTCGDADSTIRIWNLSDGRCERAIRLDSLASERNTGTCVTRDGRCAIVGGITVLGGATQSTVARVSVWDMSTGTFLRQMSSSGSATGLSVSPDGEWLAAGGSSQVALWRLSQGSLEWSRTRPMPLCLAVTRDSRTVVTGEWNGRLSFWQIADARPVRAIDLPVPQGWLSYVGDVQITPDGRHAVAALSMERSTWQASAGRSATERTADCAICVVRLSDGTIVQKMDIPGQSISSILVTPDGANAVAACRRKSQGAGRPADYSTLKVFRLSDGHELASSRPRRGTIAAIAILPDSTRLASAEVDATISLWRLQDASFLRTVGRGTYSRIIPERNGRYILARSRQSVERMSLEDGSGAYADFRDTGDEGYQMILSPDGEHLVTGYEDGRIRVNRVDNGAPIRVLEGHKNAVKDIEMTSDGRYLVSTDWSSIRIWGVP